MKKPLLLDVSLNGRFICQLKYDKRGFPEEIGGGRYIEVHRMEDLEAFVREKRPSLRGKDIKIAFSDQKV